MLTFTIWICWNYPKCDTFPLNSLSYDHTAVRPLIRAAETLPSLSLSHSLSQISPLRCALRAHLLCILIDSVSCALSLSLSYELQKFWLMRLIIGAMFTDHHRNMDLTLVVRSKWSSSVLSALRYDIIGGWQENRTTIQPLYVFNLLPIQSHPCNIYICCCLVLNGLTYWAEIQCALYAMGYLRWMTVYEGISCTMEQTNNKTSIYQCSFGAGFMLLACAFWSCTLYMGMCAGYNDASW